MTIFLLCAENPNQSSQLSGLGQYSYHEETSQLTDKVTGFHVTGTLTLIWSRLKDMFSLEIFFFDLGVKVAKQYQFLKVLHSKTSLVRKLVRQSNYFCADEKCIK